MKSFILIDGNAILHRAYHALPPLTDKNGVVVNAVYGFFSMFLKIIEDLKPSYIAVCFDRPKPTFRQALYAGYQQHRPAMADDLVPQIGLVHDILAKIGVTIFEVDGYEADDLIGTIAYQTQNSKLKTQNLETIIVSGDRDLLQLVNGHVRVLMPVTGFSNTLLYDAQKVEEKYGVKPSQFIDYKALVGDSSDGYPGVSGIGPKTASSLLQKYGTFENLYTHVSELTERIGKQLAIDAEQAALAKKLATIVTDVPVTLELAETDCCYIDADKIKEEFEKLGFKTLQNRIPKQIMEEVKRRKDGQLGLL